MYPVDSKTDFTYLSREDKFKIINDFSFSVFLVLDFYLKYVLYLCRSFQNDLTSMVNPKSKENEQKTKHHQGFRS